MVAATAARAMAPISAPALGAVPPDMVAAAQERRLHTFVVQNFYFTWGSLLQTPPPPRFWESYFSPSADIFYFFISFPLQLAQIMGKIFPIWVYQRLCIPVPFTVSSLSLLQEVKNQSPLDRKADSHLLKTEKKKKKTNKNRTLKLPIFVICVTGIYGKTL